MEQKFCDKCGKHLLADDSAFCAYCGAPVLRNTTSESPPPSTPSVEPTPVLEAQSKRTTDATKKPESQVNPANEPATRPDEIRKLGDLHAQGVLSNEELAAALATIDRGAEQRSMGKSASTQSIGHPTAPGKITSTQQPDSSTTQVTKSGPWVADEPRFVYLRVKTPWMRHPLSKDWLFWVAIAVLFFSIGPLVNTLSRNYPDGFSNVGVGAAFIDALFILIPLPTVLIGAIAVVRRLIKKNDFVSRLKTPPVDQNKGWKSDPLEVGFERWWTGDAWTANIKRYEALGMGWPAAGTLIVFFVCYWFTFLLFS